MTPRWRAVLQVQRLLRTLIANHVPLGILHVEVDRATNLADRDLVKAEADISGRGIVFELARQHANELVGSEPFAARGDSTLIYAVDAALRGARARLDVDPKATECIKSIDDVLLRLAAARKAEKLVGDEPFDKRQDDTGVPVVSSFAEALSWHGQREKWRALFEHLRELRGEAQRAFEATADQGANAVVGMLDELVAWLGQHQPDPRRAGEPRDLLRRIGDELCRRIQRAKLASETSIDAPAAAVHDELVELLAFVEPLHGAPMPELEQFDEFLASSEFYDLMQTYRTANVVTQAAVVDAFEAVKAALRKAVRR